MKFNYQEGVPRKFFGVVYKELNPLKTANFLRISSPVNSVQNGFVQIYDVHTALSDRMLFPTNENLITIVAIVNDKTSCT